jgi:hypothetical protein
MELADPRLIDQLLTKARRDKGPGSGSPRSTGPRMRRTMAPPDERVYQPPAYKTCRCRCGVCAGCKENERWERIFAEKFADPTYYSVPSSATSLRSIRYSRHRLKTSSKLSESGRNRGPVMVLP